MQERPFNADTVSIDFDSGEVILSGVHVGGNGKERLAEYRLFRGIESNQLQDDLGEPFTWSEDESDGPVSISSISSPFCSNIVIDLNFEERLLDSVTFTSYDELRSMRYAAFANYCKQHLGQPDFSNRRINVWRKEWGQATVYYEGQDDYACIDLEWQHKAGFGEKSARYFRVLFGRGS